MQDATDATIDTTPEPEQDHEQESEQPTPATPSPDELARTLAAATTARERAEARVREAEAAHETESRRAHEYETSVRDATAMIADSDPADEGRIVSLAEARMRAQARAEACRTRVQATDRALLAARLALRRAAELEDRARRDVASDAAERLWRALDAEVEALAGALAAKIDAAAAAVVDARRLVGQTYGPARVTPTTFAKALRELLQRTAEGADLQRQRLRGALTRARLDDARGDAASAPDHRA